MKRLYSLIIMLYFSISVFAQNDTSIVTFDAMHQGFGGGLNRTEVDTFFFPKDLSIYSSIELDIDLGCPTGGCDPWDRFANIKVIKDGEEFEIARYMTPYKKACGWTVDVSDYRSILSDTVILSSFIDTWVNPAWLVTLTFTFKVGAPDYLYSRVENLWSNEYIVYGDTTQDITIGEQQRMISNYTESAKVKLVNTGHGQGNYQNAAEFSQKTHYLVLNNDTIYDHFLWTTGCNSNPGCSPQNGTWTYNRAGWCPGKAVVPVDVDITSQISPGISKFDYKFADYFNTCSPNNPNCTTSGSCPDCDYNYNGHTEPHYKLHGQLIQKSNNPLLATNVSEHYKELNVSVYPNPAKDKININSNETILSIEIYDVMGKVLLQSKPMKTATSIDTQNLSSGMYIVKIESELGGKTVKLMKH